MVRILYLHAGAEMYGADKVLLDLIRNLDKERFQPLVVLPCNGVLVKELEKAQVKVCAMEYPIMRRKYFNPKGLFSYIFLYFRFSRQLKKLARKWQIQLVHANTAAVMEGIYISRKLNIPLIWCIHEIIVSPRIMFRFTSLMIARFAKSVVIVSKAAKEHLESSGYFQPGKIRVIYNGVNSAYFNPDHDASRLYREFHIPSDARIIGMIGRVNSWKGQSDFLKAAEIVMSRDEKAYAVLVGDAFAGEEWRVRELDREISASPYKDRIINVGYRTDNFLFYKWFDLLVLPSIHPDPLPTVVLEAMATGKPVVGYCHGGICEMVEDGRNGLLAEVGNPEDLAEKIQTLLRDDSLRLQMGLQARLRQSRLFSIDSYVKNFTDLYHELATKQD